MNQDLHNPFEGENSHETYEAKKEEERKKNKWIEETFVFFQFLDQRLIE
jgi:hypothetical protein